jgi:sugar-phosphatase
MGVTPAGCVVIEDSPAGIAAARAAGMRVIGLMRTHIRADLVGSVVIAEGLGSIRVSIRPEVESSILIEID